MSKIAILLLIFVFSFVFWNWFLPGPRVAVDFPLVSENSLKSFLDIPRVWSEYGAEGLGEYSVYTIWSWPMMFLSALLAHLGIGFALIERILLIIFFLLFGSWGIWRTSQNVKLSSTARIAAVFFYLTNTYILLVIDGGQLVVGLAYAFFPISFLAIEESIKRGWVKKIVAGMSIWILGFLDFRFIYILIILCLLRFLYEFLFLKREEWGIWIQNWFKTAVTSGLIIAGLNAYWLVPIIKKPLSSSTYLMLTQTNFESFITLGHSMLLIAPHWFKNVFGKFSLLNFEFIIIPVLVFLAPILRPKDKTVGFWLIVALLSIFLAKGTAEPLGQIYPFLFHNIPGFSLFRDSTKFFFLVALSFTILLSMTLDEIIHRLKDSRIKVLLSVGLVVYLLFLIRPVWLGQMTGTFSPPLYQREYSKLKTLIEKDQEFSRIFWIPSIPPLGLVSDNHPSLEAVRFVQKRPFAIGVEGAYEIFNFIREAPYMGQLFDVASIGYIAYPLLDPRRDDLHPDNIKYYYTFSSQLSKLPWLSRVEDFSIPLWKTVKHQDKFFVASNIWWAIGSDSIYSEATKSSNLRLSNNAFVFAEESPGLLDRIEEVPEAKIVLNHKTLIDLAASFIKSESLIFPAKLLGFDPDKTSGWWKREEKDLIAWRYFLKTKYGIDNQDFDLGGGWAVGEGERKFTIYNLQFTKGKILLARGMESSRSGKLKFYQDNQFIGEVSTNISGDANIRWFEVGQMSKDRGGIEIISSGDINVVNALAVLGESEWIKYQKVAKEYQDKGRVVEFDGENTQEGEGNVTYQKVNPTKYLIRISGLTKPTFLIFSENFDGLWKLGSQSPIPVYSLLNGFRVEKDGDYIIEFEAQKYVYLGLVIAGITVVIFSLLLLKTRR